MDLQILDDGKGVKFSATPVNQGGKPVTLPSGVVPVWASSDPTVLTVAADPSDLGGGNTIKDYGAQAPIDVVADTTATGFTIQEAAQ